jgi:hypothetical protein
MHHLKECIGCLRHRIHWRIRREKENKKNIVDKLFYVFNTVQKNKGALALVTHCFISALGSVKLIRPFKLFKLNNIGLFYRFNSDTIAKLL